MSWKSIRDEQPNPRLGTILYRHKKPGRGDRWFVGLAYWCKSHHWVPDVHSTEKTEWNQVEGQIDLQWMEIPLSSDPELSRMFPIQGGWDPDAREYFQGTKIPWWLAEIAYEEYSRRYGRQQSLELLGKRGGFGRKELVALIRRERPR